MFGIVKNFHDIDGYMMDQLIKNVELHLCFQLLVSKTDVNYSIGLTTHQVGILQVPGQEDQNLEHNHNQLST